MRHEFLTWKWMFMVLVFVLFGWSTRTKVTAYANQQELPFNQWDIVFTSLNSPFFILYLLLPFWLFLSGQLLIKEWEYTLLIRLKSFPKWMLYTIVKICPFLLLLQFLWIIESFIVTAGLPQESHWSIWGSTEGPMNVFLFSLQKTGFSPWLILLIQTALISLFLIAIHVLAASVYVLFPKPGVMAGTSVFLFIGAVLSFKVVPASYHYAKVTNYSILSYSYDSFNSVVPPFLVLSFFLFLCFAFIAVRSWAKMRRVFTFLADYYRIPVYIAICVLGIAAPFTHPGVKVTTVWENLYLLFYGVSEEGFSLYVYLFYCVVFIGFVYLFQLHLSELLNGRIYYLLIRYKSLNRWFGQLMKKTVLSILGLLLLLAGATIVFGLLQGLNMKWDGGEADSALLPYYLYHFFINGLLQMLNYILILFIVSWIWQEAAYSLGAIGVLIVMGLPFINPDQWLPFALNSMGYVTQGSHEIFRITIVLVTYLLLEMGLIIYLFRKRKISL
ncbi:hypothetical protein [Paenibacillus lutrae]|uniref:Permease n=1 Tax=Paenibacillus lutrae TaxID=2078573 RepID=A0A7X3FLY1_9BACL|nr:hypothetical protein [Paenibacillus lutrae]MVP01924.1 hypothetical protein [Paenibacillus lutrae]